MLTRLVVLAGFNARAQAYLQALAKAGITPAVVLAYGTRRAPSVARASALPGWSGVALADLEEPIETTCTRARWPLRHCGEARIDAPALRAALQESLPSLVVFAGYGGQIVGADLLGVAPFLHVHTGDLPAYRGSTTLYYSVLERRSCAATAFLLRTGIDTGPIVARRDYPLPPAAMDVDLLYDNALRADLLIHALGRLDAHGMAGLGEQPADEGHTYFVIHPVLKHIALLSLGTAAAARDEGSHAT